MAARRAGDLRRLERGHPLLNGARADGGLDADALAIAKTVIYASLFDYPLTIEQLRASLIESRQSEADILATYAACDRLQSIVEHRRGLYFLRGRHDMALTRAKREARSRAFLAEHRRLIRCVCALPYVRAVALSGSLAHLNLDRDGDLDLFIVTRGPRVWSVTVAVVLLAKMMRRRRVLCANFVVSDAQLELDQQDLFTANQVINLKPILGPEVVAEVIEKNPFVRQFYPNFDLSVARSPISVTRRWPRMRRIAEALGAAPSILVERLCRWAYGRYLRRRVSTWRSPEQVQLGAGCLKLHTQSHRQRILERYDRAVDAVHSPAVAKTARAV